MKSAINRALSWSQRRPSPSSEYGAVNILADLQGHRRTQKTRLPVSADGSPIPWYTYPAIEYFNQLRADDLRIFEYGSGNSSLYWAGRGAQVWSVDHDTAWYESMQQRAAKLQSLLLRPSPDAYASAINEIGGEFDIIVVDGVWRNECAAKALPHLKADGVIILDNSDWYIDVSQYLKERGFLQIDFNGFGPINDYCWTTSILLRAPSVLSGRMGHPQPIGGIQVQRGPTW